MTKKQRRATFAEIVREPTFSEITPVPGTRVPFEGAVDVAGVFRDPSGRPLDLTAEEINAEWGRAI